MENRLSLFGRLAILNWECGVREHDCILTMFFEMHFRKSDTMRSRSRRQKLFLDVTTPVTSQFEFPLLSLKEWEGCQ